MICTIYMKYREPLTQIWVKGKDEMYFPNKERMDQYLEDLERHFSRLYGANFELRFCDWGD